MSGIFWSASSAFGSYVSAAASAFDFNKATLSGALDVIAVQHDDGVIACTPFHVRFGKFKLLRSRDKLVYVYVNGKKTHLRMQLGDAGEAYFIHRRRRRARGPRQVEGGSGHPSTPGRSASTAASESPPSTITGDAASIGSVETLPLSTLTREDATSLLASLAAETASEERTQPAPMAALSEPPKAGSAAGRSEGGSEPGLLGRGLSKPHDRGEAAARAEEGGEDALLSPHAHGVAADEPLAVGSESSRAGAGPSAGAAAARGVPAAAADSRAREAARRLDRGAQPSARRRRRASRLLHGQQHQQRRATRTRFARFLRLARRRNLYLSADTLQRLFGPRAAWPDAVAALADGVGAGTAGVLSAAGDRLVLRALGDADAAVSGLPRPCGDAMSDSEAAYRRVPTLLASLELELGPSAALASGAAAGAGAAAGRAAAGAGAAAGRAAGAGPAARKRSVAQRGTVDTAAARRRRSPPGDGAGAGAGAPVRLQARASATGAVAAETPLDEALWRTVRPGHAGGAQAGEEEEETVEGGSPGAAGDAAASGASESADVGLTLDAPFSKEVGSPQRVRVGSGSVEAAAGGMLARGLAGIPTAPFLPLSAVFGLLACLCVNPRHAACAARLPVHVCKRRSPAAAQSV